MSKNSLFQIISSRHVMLALLLSVGVSYLCFTFGDNTYKNWIIFLFSRPIGLVLYIGLIANIIFSIIRAASKKLAPPPSTVDEIMRMNVWTKTDSENIEKWVKTMGFKRIKSGENLVFSSRGRYSFLPGAMLRVGVALLMSALLISFHVRKVETVSINEGGEFGGLRLTAIESDLPDDYLQIGEKSSFILKNVSAVFSPATNEKIKVGSGFPVKAGDNYLRVNHIGFSQPVTFERPSGDKSEAVLSLDILPPGKTYQAELSGGEVLSFTLYPSETITKGLVTGESYNLKEPLYSIKLQKGGLRYEFILKPGESTESGGYKLALGGHSRFINLMSVYDPALFWVYAGTIVVILALIAMLSRFFWYERRICAIRDGDKTVVGFNEEFFRKWGIMRFYALEESLQTDVSVDEAEKT